MVDALWECCAFCNAGYPVCRVLVYEPGLRLEDFAGIFCWNVLVEDLQVHEEEFCVE